MKNRIIQGYWDCTYCDTTGIKADVYNKNCPHCGKTQSDGIKFYVKDKNEVAEEETIKKAGTQAKWVCAYCEGLNYSSDDTCKHCGGDKKEADDDYFSSKEKRESRLREQQNEQQGEQQDKQQSVRKYNYGRHRRTNTASKITWIIAIIFVIGLVASILTPKNQTVLITGVDWQRSIEIEELKTFEESDWNLPNGARLKYSRIEFSHYDEVIDYYETVTEQVERERISHHVTEVTGHKDLGNGLFEEETREVPVYEKYYETVTRQVPVYKKVAVDRTKYYYEIDRWTKCREVNTSGQDKKAYWGEVILEELERKGNSSEKYSANVTVVNKKNKTETYTFEYSDWEQLKEGNEYKIKVSISNKATIIK